MKAVVLLFKDNSTDSESFVYPNLKKVKISIEGKPNQVYARDLTMNVLHKEVHGVFSSKIKYDQNLSEFYLFNNSFSVIIDLHSNKDNLVYKSGKTVMKTQSGILLELIVQPLQRIILFMCLLCEMDL